MGLHYDISTLVIDINCTISENLDLPCKNIFLLVIAILTFKKPTGMPEKSTPLETQM